jgi:hypothetical protein
MKRLQSSEPLHTKIHLILLLLRPDGLYGYKPQSFPHNQPPKIRESQQLFYGGRLMSKIFEEFQHHAIQTKIVQHFGVFFHQIKVRHPIRRKDSIQVVCRRMRRLEAFLYGSAQNFELNSKLQDQNEKIKKKPIVVDVLSEAFPMIPLHAV